MSRERDTREQVIADLVGGLEPVAPAPVPAASAFVWLAVARGVATGLMVAYAPFRPGFADQLLAHPRFALESLAGLGAIAVVAWAAFRSLVPGTATLPT